MNFAKKALTTACLILAAGSASAQSGIQSPTPSWNLDYLDGYIDSKYKYQGQGAGVPVFVIDSGLATDDPGFAAEFGTNGRVQLWKKRFNNFTNDCSAKHGTHVTALLGGNTHGVAKRADIYVLSIMDCNDPAILPESFVWAIDEIIAAPFRAPGGQRGVINMSLSIPGNGNTDGSAMVKAAVQRAVDAGFVVVAAAGNGNGDACANTPAHMSSVITVSSMTETNDVAPRSRTGTCVDIFAPGENIKAFGGYTINTSTGMMGGTTSFATPHVAGAAASLMGLAPELSASQIGPELMTQSFKGFLNDTQLNGAPNRVVKAPTGVIPLCVPKVFNGTKGSVQYCRLDVPKGQSSVTFRITGGWGDADLYVRFNDLPQDFVYDCRPYRPGNEETCTMSLSTNPHWVNGGPWFVMLKGYADYSTNFSYQLQ